MNGVSRLLPVAMLGFLVTSLGAQRRKPAKPAAPTGTRCTMELISAERQGYGSQPLPGQNTTNYDVAGHVHMRCRGQKIFLDADSVHAVAGDFFRFMTGEGYRAHYRDSIYDVMADTITYIRRTEKVEMRGAVHMLDRLTGSTMDGPYVDYFRAVKGVNDTATVLAIQRPTVRYITTLRPGDTTRHTPYVLIGDFLHGFGERRLRGNGAVSIDHDSLRGTGDSLWIDRDTVATTRLMGGTARLWRRGADSFMVRGREVRLVFAHDSLRDLHAFVDADVSRAASDVSGDTVTIAFVHEKVDRTDAWAHKAPAKMHASGYDVTGDSVVVDSPGELLREVRAYGNAQMTGPPDTTFVMPPRPRAALRGDSTARDSAQRRDTLPAPPPRSTMWGATVVAQFRQIDSAGTQVTRLEQLHAFGAARSLVARMVAHNGKPSPSINYTRADTIQVLMKAGDSVAVSAVHAWGHVDGVQEETATLRRRPDTTQAAPPAKKP